MLLKSRLFHFRLHEPRRYSVRTEILCRNPTRLRHTEPAARRINADALMICRSENRFGHRTMGPMGSTSGGTRLELYFMGENNDFLESAANDPCAAKVHTARRTLDTRNNNNAKSHPARERNSRCRGKPMYS